MSEVHGMLRRNRALLPGGLLVFSSVLVLYQHMTDGDFNNVRTWLALILATMLPLAYLDMSVPDVPDPMKLLSKLGPKVLLMHFCFLTVRLRLLLHSDAVKENLTNVGGMAVMAGALCIGFDAHKKGLADHGDIALVVLVAMVVAGTTEMLGSFLSFSHIDGLRSEYVPEWLESFLISLATHTELLSLSPAVHVVVRSEKKDDSWSVMDLNLAKRMAYTFAGTLIGFYFIEDALTAYVLVWDTPMSAAGHLLHFLLMVDFCVYFVTCAHNPGKNSRTFMMMLSEGCGV